jgi:hypothetical protein
MRSVTEPHWEKSLSRYFHAHSLAIAWDGAAKRFKGLRGHMIARVNPKLESDAWQQMPKRIRDYEAKDRNPDRLKVIVIATNKRYGDSIDDTLAVMRLGTLMPILKAYQESLDRR